MNSDIRLSIGFFDHPKTIKLQREIGAEGVFSLMRLWLWTAQNRPGGILTGMDEDDIEIVARWSGEQGVFCAATLKLRLLDACEGTFAVHNWRKHNTWQSDAERRSSASRLSRMAKTHPDLYKTLEGAGIKGISRESYAVITASEDPHNAVERMVTKASSPLLSSPYLSSPYETNSFPFSPSPIQANVKTAEEEKERDDLPVDSEPYRLAKLMRDTLKANVPTLREPDLQTWAHSLDDALNFDESMHDAALVESVIRWACSDRFWKAHIQNPGKLREKFDQLTARMESERQKEKEVWKSPAQRRIEANREAGREAKRLLFGDTDKEESNDS